MRLRRLETTSHLLRPIGRKWPMPPTIHRVSRTRSGVGGGADRTGVPTVFEPRTLPGESRRAGGHTSWSMSLHWIHQNRHSIFFILAPCSPIRPAGSARTFFWRGEREAFSMEGRAGPGPELATGILPGDVFDLSTNGCQHVSVHSPACCIRCGLSGRVAQGSQVRSPHGRTVSIRLVHRGTGLAVSLCGLSPIALSIDRARLPPAPGVLRSSALHHGR